MTTLTILFMFITVVFISIGLLNYLSEWHVSYADLKISHQEFYDKRDTRIVFSISMVIIFSVLSYITTAI